MATRAGATVTESAAVKDALDSKHLEINHDRKQELNGFRRQNGEHLKTRDGDEEGKRQEHVRTSPEVHHPNNRNPRKREKKKSKDTIMQKNFPADKCWARMEAPGARPGMRWMSPMHGEPNALPSFLRFENQTQGRTPNGFRLPNSNTGESLQNPEGMILKRGFSVQCGAFTGL